MEVLTRCCSASIHIENLKSEALPVDRAELMFFDLSLGQAGKDLELEKHRQFRRHLTTYLVWAMALRENHKPSRRDVGPVSKFWCNVEAPSQYKQKLELASKLGYDCVVNNLEITTAFDEKLLGCAATLIQFVCIGMHDAKNQQSTPPIACHWNLINKE